MEIPLFKKFYRTLVIKYINSDQFQQINKMWNEEYPIKLKDRFELLLEGVEKYNGTGRYRAAFKRQVKNRVLTLKRAKRYEKVKIYRSTDPKGA